MFSALAVSSLSVFLPQTGDTLQVQHRLPTLGETLSEVRFVDPQCGIVQRSVRDARGRVVDLDALLFAERAQRLQSQGKLSPELAARAAAVDPEAYLDVVFWLREGEHPDFLESLHSLVEAGVPMAEARQSVLGLARESFEPANRAFAQRLSDAGIEVGLIGDYWPDVFARLRVSDLAAWAAREEVDAVYYAFSEGGPEQNNAQGTMRTGNVHDAGINGGTGPTKVLVNDCGEVTAVHPWLPPVVKMTTNAVQTHPCGVAGNICMNGGGYLSSAFGLPQLYSADGCGSDAPAQAAWSWGLGNGIDVGNCSWWNGNKGSIVFLDRFFDYTIRNYSVMLFKSNGNQGGTSDPSSTSPGNGFNMISVGCYNDANDVDWVNDAMASYSSWKNPVEGHEKPEISTPGDVCTSTNATNGTQSFNGTSSASPLACGVGVLLCNAQHSLLASMPTLKAAIMVGAWHNVEGAAVLSDKDGAGSVHTTASHALLRDGQYESGMFTAASFPANVYDKVIGLAAGDETRVIALWFSDPDSAGTTDVLKMDLDMTVLDPSGAVVASSISVFNPFELVQFTPAVSGNFTVRLTRQRFLGTSEPYAIAWSTRQDAAVADVSFIGTPTLGANLTTNFRSRYDKNVPYVGVASLYTTPWTLPLSGGWVLPLGPDRLALYSRAGALPSFFTNFSGTLDANGRASGIFKIPSHPVWLGITFYVSMYTHAVGSPGLVRDTAPAASFTVQ